MLPGLLAPSAVLGTTQFLLMASWQTSPIDYGFRVVDVTLAREVLIFRPASRPPPTTSGGRRRP
jgi:hypothetical protein